MYISKPLRIETLSQYRQVNFHLDHLHGHLLRFIRYQQTYEQTQWGNPYEIPLMNTNYHKLSLFPASGLEISQRTEEN